MLYKGPVERAPVCPPGFGGPLCQPTHSTDKNQFACPCTLQRPAGFFQTVSIFRSTPWRQRALHIALQREKEMEVVSAWFPCFEKDGLKRAETSCCPNVSYRSDKEANAALLCMKGDNT